jgi:hypothetical protein
MWNARATVLALLVTLAGCGADPIVAGSAVSLPEVVEQASDSIASTTNVDGAATSVPLVPSVPAVVPSPDSVPTTPSEDPVAVTGYGIGDKVNPTEVASWLSKDGIVVDALPAWIVVGGDDQIVVGYVRMDRVWERLPSEQQMKLPNPWLTIWNEDGTQTIGCMTNDGLGESPPFILFEETGTEQDCDA